MARRKCPRCGAFVDEVIVEEETERGTRVAKLCPRCGYEFISYIVKRRA